MGLAGQQRGYRLHVHGQLRAESAADFHGNRLDLGDREADQPCGVVADGEMSLAAGPDGEVAVVVPHGGAGVGFDVTLVNGGSGHAALDHDVGVGKSRVHVAHAELKVVGDVGAGGFVIVVEDAAGAGGRGVESGQPFVDSG